MRPKNSLLYATHITRVGTETVAGAQRLEKDATTDSITVFITKVATTGENAHVQEMEQ